MMRTRRTQPQTRLCLALAFTAWFGNALYAAGAPDGYLKLFSPALVAGAMIAFLVIFGRRSEGDKGLFLFVITVFLIGWTFETISVLSGVPFGNYHYTDIMAPFLGQVSVSVLPAYCVMGFVSWLMARIMLGRLNGPPDTVSRFVTPVIAALLMVLWDLCMDPLRATVEGRWIWHDGGVYYGVPALNFAGWFAVTWIMFQSYALIGAKDRASARSVTENQSRWMQMSVPLMYLAFPIEYLLNPLFANSAGATVLINDVRVSVASVHFDIAMVTLLTMVPVSLIAALRIWRTGAAFEAGREVTQPVLVRRDA
jgi:putative membrane protein